jgi:hypothetical protein
LQFIKKYNGNDFVHLPGLIQCHLRYELMHTACRQNYCSKETSLEKALEYLGYSPLDAPTFNMALKQAMTRLTDKEQTVPFVKDIFKRKREAAVPAGTAAS